MDDTIQDTFISHNIAIQRLNHVNDEGFYPRKIQTSKRDNPSQKCTISKKLRDELD